MGLPQQDAENAVSQRFTLQATARQLLPDFRVAQCLRVLAGSVVEVFHHAEFSTATYGGLQTCGSVHVCPCCGAKIAERRREEISRAITSCSDAGGSLIFATFTLRHELTDDLADVGGALNEAYRKLKQSRMWKLFEERHEIIGSIAATEYTHGVAGWHPHKHVLFFVRRQHSLREVIQFEKWLQQRWGAAVAGLGRWASAQHGVKVDHGDAAIAAYLVKVGRGWTLADELAKANRKRGRGGRTPQQLLRDSTWGDERAGLLFQEYARYTYRGNALVWSRGLRAALGLVELEKTDEEIAGEESAGGRLLVVLDRDVWRVVLAHDARADLLLVAGAGEVERVAQFLAGLGVELDRAALEVPAAPLAGADAGDLAGRLERVLSLARLDKTR